MRATWCLPVEQVKTASQARQAGGRPAPVAPQQAADELTDEHVVTKALGIEPFGSQQRAHRLAILAAQAVRMR